MVVKDGDVIKVHYIGRFGDGEIFESSYDDGEPLIFKVGDGTLIPGLDRGFIGMRQGEKKEIVVLPNDAYGDYDENKLIKIDTSDFPEGEKPEIGMEMDLEDEEGNILPAVIKEIGKEKIIMDANHPLAGKKTVFTVEVLETGCELPEFDDAGNSHHHHG